MWNPLPLLKTAVAGVNWQALALKAAGYAIVAMVLFGAGYYTAVKGQQNSNATVATKAQQAQAKKDSGDYKVTQVDLQQRAAANNKAVVKYQTLYNTRTVLVPAPPAICVVAAEVMKQLNDPDLIGSAK